MHAVKPSNYFCGFLPDQGSVPVTVYAYRQAEDFETSSLLSKTGNHNKERIVEDNATQLGRIERFFVRRWLLLFLCVFFSVGLFRLLFLLLIHRDVCVVDIIIILN